MGTIIRFFIENVPSMKTITLIGPIFLIWAYCCLRFASYLKCHKKIKTGYTRKTFHILIFLSAAILHRAFGLPIVCLFGGMTSVIIAYAVVRGNGHPLYEAIAREKDAPYRTYYIVVPYFATLIGGLFCNIIFGPFSIVGYLVGGLGDAAGEPVGTRWGKHKYIVPSLGRIKTERSVEGSLGVLIVSTIAILIGVSLLPIQLNWALLAIIPIIALACAALEAISPHGWDNATMQIAPALMFYVLLH
jgi:phytol kinase